MSYYENYQINSDDVSREAGAPCCGYGTGPSHERIIQSAGGEIGYDWFRDPRPNHEGPIYADRVFINERTNQIQGINFNDKDGKFCCAYFGSSYSDIKDSNRRDLDVKRTNESKYAIQEECSVKNTDGEQQENNQNLQNGIKR